MKFQYFMTSNVGGGGQTVSRFPPYLNLIDDLAKENIGILLNYHYLCFYEKEGERRTKRMVFDKDHLKLLEKDDINFSRFFHKFNSGDTEKKKIEFNIQGESDYKFEILLDSGSGKILADNIIDYDLNFEQSQKLIFDLVEHNIDFGIEKGSKYLIAMDFCKKNTYKKDEGKSKNYQEIISKLLDDQKIQNDLLEKSLEYGNERGIGIFAPIHGKSYDDFIDHYHSILELESKTNYKFSGFALGGLSNFKGKLASGNIGKIVKEIRLNDDRDIHILGSSGINKIPILMFAGANFFDCHTPWRRANDQDIKYSMPLLNKNLEIIEDSPYSLKNIPIAELRSYDFSCNCPICENFNYRDIKKMIENRDSDKEGYYLGKLLVYFHGVYQYHYMLKFLEKCNSRKNFQEFLNLINNEKLRSDLLVNLEFMD